MLDALLCSSLEDLFSCTFCCFRCSDKQTFIRNVFEAYCYNKKFYYECMISSCSHVFTTGATYASFLTHCNRKHSNLREVLRVNSDHHCDTSNLHESFVLETLINQPQSDLSTDDVLLE